MEKERICLELFTEDHLDAVRAIDRSDVSEAFVDNADTIMEYTQYGLQHNCIGIPTLSVMARHILA